MRPYKIQRWVPKMTAFKYNWNQNRDVKNNLTLHKLLSFTRKSSDQVEYIHYKDVSEIVGR